MMRRIQLIFSKRRLEGKTSADIEGMKHQLDWALAHLGFVPENGYWDYTYYGESNAELFLDPDLVMFLDTNDFEKVTERLKDSYVFILDADLLGSDDEHWQHLANLHNSDQGQYLWGMIIGTEFLVTGGISRIMSISSLKCLKVENFQLDVNFFSQQVKPVAAQGGDSKTIRQWLQNLIENREKSAALSFILIDDELPDFATYFDPLVRALVSGLPKHLMRYDVRALPALATLEDLQEKVQGHIHALPQDIIKLVITDVYIESENAGLKLAQRLKSWSNVYIMLFTGKDRVSKNPDLLSILQRNVHILDMKGVVLAKLNDDKYKNSLHGVLQTWWGKQTKTLKLLGNNKIEYSGLAIKLEPKEYIFLEKLVKANGAVVSYGDIIKHCWPEDNPRNTRVAEGDSLIRKYAQKLRGKLGRDAIITTPSRGLKLNPSVKILTDTD